MPSSICNKKTQEHYQLAAKLNRDPRKLYDEDFFYAKIRLFLEENGLIPDQQIASQHLYDIGDPAGQCHVVPPFPDEPNTNVIFVAAGRGFAPSGTQAIFYFDYNGDLYLQERVTGGFSSTGFEPLPSQSFPDPSTFPKK